MEYVGGASGAVLGYIANDVPGAFIGWSYGRQYGRRYNLRNFPKQKKMAPTNANKRKVTGTLMNWRSMKRGNNWVSTPLRPKSKRVVRFKKRYVPKTSTSSLWNHSKVVKKGGFRKKFKKRVKVSSRLRKKIQKVVAGDKPRGIAQEIAYGGQRLPDGLDNKQVFADITILNSPDSADPHFSNQKIVDAASVLWNEKVPTKLKTHANVQNFPTDKLQVDVINSYVTYKFRNNSQRVYYMSLMEIAPRSQQVLGAPLPVWDAALAYQATLEGPNQLSALSTELHTHPSMLPDFKRLFKVTTTKIEIAPGGEYSWFVQGPKDYKFNSQKTWNGSTYQNLNTHSRWTCCTYYGDLVSDSAGNAGRYYNHTSSSSAQLVWEATVRYVLALPEQTGFINPAVYTAGVQPNGQRQFSYALKTWSTEQSGALVRYDDEQPGTAEAPPS